MKEFCVKNGRYNQLFQVPETVRWLDLTDPDPRILRQIYTGTTASACTE